MRNSSGRGETARNKIGVYGQSQHRSSSNGNNNGGVKKDRDNAANRKASANAVNAEAKFPGADFKVRGRKETHATIKVVMSDEEGMLWWWENNHSWIRSTPTFSQLARAPMGWCALHSTRTQTSGWP